MEQQDVELFREYRKTGDRAIRNQLVQKYQKTAAIIARKFKGRGVDDDDLYQIACEGLILGIENYDPDRDNDFAAFITPTIAGRIRNYFRDNAKAIKLPRKLYAVTKEVKRVTDEYMRVYGKRPTVRQLTELTGLSEDLIVQALEFRAPVSLDTPIKAEDHDTTTATSDTMQASPVDPYDDLDESMAMREEIKKLTPREQQIVKLRFVDGKSQSETGKIMGLSQMFISRLERHIIEKLQEGFSSGGEQDDA
ncbi:MAG: sigma-70 family RNA polymerase sigma factor [Clostridia bacterium]|nr:sigma-70 family RNA polymerase sigma factor [Clostridia bacterium]